MAHSSPSSASEMKGSSIVLMAMSPQRILFGVEWFVSRPKMDYSRQIGGD